jgi:hypothetical protein
MKTSIEVVKTADSPEEYKFEMALPESIEEAQQVYGEDNALWLLNSGLKVKLQNTAREAFRQGKSQAEAEEAVRAYRPGGGARKGAKARSLELITERAGDIKDDPELKEAVKEAFAASNFKEVVRLLEEGGE